jgi:hypothetical protein
LPKKNRGIPDTLLPAPKRFCQTIIVIIHIWRQGVQEQSRQPCPFLLRQGKDLGFNLKTAAGFEQTRREPQATTRRTQNQ